MPIPRSIQSQFYLRQLQHLEETYEQYLRAKASALYESNRLHAGLFVGVDERRGNVLVRFRKNHTPRRKMLFTTFCSGRSPKKWGNLQYGELRATAVQGLTSDAQSVFLAPYRENEDWVVVGFSRIDLRLVEKLEKDALMVFAEPEPPWKYLQQMSELTPMLPQNDPVLDLDCTGEGVFEPIPLSRDENPLLYLTQVLNAQEEALLQGPPGTGKTYLMAQICAQYLKQGASICVTALTNRALMELAGKIEFLKPFLDQGAVFKTSLSSDEKQEIRNLQRLDEVRPMPGRLVLSTYYLLSTQAGSLMNTYSGFDLIIIEEASQAFLGTLAVFRQLGEKAIIVGDPLQLPPIWDQRCVSDLDKRVSLVANGLSTYANYGTTPAFRLTDTFRLPKRAAKATGVFYDNTLQSAVQNQPPFDIKLPAKFSALLHPEGGPAVLFQRLADRWQATEQAIPFLKQFLKEFEAANPDKRIAILSPFRDLNNSLQGALYPISKRLEQVEIETIDRIQGMTTDFTILLLPLENSSFALALNRFNVATSRSRTHTLIIMDEGFKKYFPPCHKQVQQFLENAYFTT